MVYDITEKQVDEAYRAIMENPVKDKQVDESYYHTIMQNAINNLERAVECGFPKTAIRDYLEAKKISDSEIFTLGYRDEAEKLIEILKK